MMKIEERGRGKFKPAPDYDINEVKNLLFKKIEEETKITIDTPGTYDPEELHYNIDKENIVSLFCGAGGLDLGVELAGIDCLFGEDKTTEALKNKDQFNEIRKYGIFNHVYSNDFFKEALETYRKNFPSEVFTHNQDIKKVNKFPKGEIVLGGFPCPGFSEAGPRLVDDPRNFLYIHYIRCLMQVKPKFFIAENVKGMLTLGKGEVFRQIKQDFKAAGYRVYHKLVNARDYGVPQIRERVFLVGVREDLDFEYKFPDPTHGNEPHLKPYVTLKDAIGDLEQNPGDFFEGSFSTIYMSRNRKKGWNDQSFTIQASGRQAPIHPGGSPMKKVDKDKWIFPEDGLGSRRLSVKEIKRIQTFPDWFEFSDGGNETVSKNGRLNKIYKQIGNAVPIELARAIARPIAKWIDTNITGDESMIPAEPTTNVLIALNNILQRNQTSMPTVLNEANNRINSTGDLLEFYVKDAFCGTSSNFEDSYEKLDEYGKTFSYLGNSKNPPDFIIKSGPAVEVKKAEKNTYSQIHLNSSFPKDYLYSDDTRITQSCRQAENGNWTQKDMIYAIGNVTGNHLNNLWLLYGDCYCANKDIYDNLFNKIKTDIISTIPDVEFGETNELGRLNRVDPLGITYLRILGMWGIIHPSTVFKRNISHIPNSNTKIFVLMKQETYKNLKVKPDFKYYIDSGVLKVEETQIPDPNNPAIKLDVMLFSATLT